ncbi:MAG: pyrroline-5-carboxylate reductase [Phycisphaerales bacterium]
MATRRLAIIGGGTMGTALLAGALRAGVVRAAEVTIAEPDAPRREACAALGASVVEQAIEATVALGPADVILLAVKPQAIGEVAPALRGTQSLVISIMAGVTTARLSAMLQGDAPDDPHAKPSGRVVRVMPNLAAQVGKGMSAIGVAEGVSAEDVEFVTRLFRAVGDVVFLREGLMDAFTAVAGSGPAYVFLLAEALERGAESLGLSATDARSVVRQTIIGAAAVMAADSASPGGLRGAVTSKGGTTAAACAVLEEAGFVGLFERALTAARDRGAELSRIPDR